MTVAEIIAYLETQPQDVHVAYRLNSEQCLLELSDIEIVAACPPRPDGWIHDRRPDKPVQMYLMLPGH